MIEKFSSSIAVGLDSNCPLTLVWLPPCSGETVIILDVMVKFVKMHDTF